MEILLEAGALREATTADAPANRRTIQIIDAGWGASGYYSPEILEAAANDKVITSGTKMYLNHMAESEKMDRPERDLRDIAGVFVSDAVWDGTRLVAEADLLGPNAELVGSLAPYIGVSISGAATGVHHGEVDGRSGNIVEGIAAVRSVDFVTDAGRGGKILLESARPSLVNQLAIGHGLEEATVNDKREQLQTLLRDAYSADKTYVWVRDFDEATVWFEIESPDDSGVFAQGYTGTDTLELASDPKVEVRVSTTYVPITRSGSTITEESQEDTMPQIQIEEAEHRRLLEESGQVAALQERADTAERERDELREAEATRTRSTRAVEIVEAQAKAGNIQFTPLEIVGLTSQLPVKDGALDEAAFTTYVGDQVKSAKTALAEAAQANGAGRISGHGAPTPVSTDLTEADVDKTLAGIFDRPQIGA